MARRMKGYRKAHINGEVWWWNVTGSNFIGHLGGMTIYDPSITKKTFIPRNDVLAILGIPPDKIDHEEFENMYAVSELTRITPQMAKDYIIANKDTLLRAAM